MTPEEIIMSKMLQNDAFSNQLNMQVEYISEDKVMLSMVVTDNMLNGFGIMHGGISYALCDSAFAFVSNAKGRQAVSVETSISHTFKVLPGDKIMAEAEILNESKRLARGQVKVFNQERKLVALFNGTSYYTGKNWEN